MSIAGIYYPHELQFAASGIDSVFRFDSIQFDPNYEMIKRAAGGDPYPCFVGAASSDPEMRFTTPSVKQVLDACTDFDIVRDLQASDVRMSYRRGKPQSMRLPLGNASHFVVELQQSAMLYWSSLSAREAQDATISGSLLVARTSPTVDPWLNLGSEQLESPICHEIYTLGPVFFNGRPLKSIHEINWQNNIRNYSRKTALNPKDPCWQSIHDFAPVITGKTNDLEEMAHENPAATQGLDTYGGQQMDRLQVFLRKRQRTGFYVSDATPEHIELRCFGGWKAGTSIDGSEPAEGELQFHCSQAVSTSGIVASDFLLVKNTAIAIPDSDAAPNLGAIANQNASVGAALFIQSEVGSSGVPTAWSATGLPPGVEINANSGLISGTIGSGASGVYNVALDGNNGAGASPTVNFDITIV